MSVNELADFLKKELIHDIATDAWSSQLRDANYEDLNVREEFEPILHDTNDYGAVFEGVAKLAEKVALVDADEVWKRLRDLNVEVDRVNGLFWVFIDKALAKDSNTRDFEYGFAASCAWLKLSGLHGSSLFKFFNQYLYKMILSLVRLVYRLKEFGSRSVTTKKEKKKGRGGKKGGKSSAPMMEEQEEEEENVLDFNETELDGMLEKSCEALYSLLKHVPLSACKDGAKETVFLLRDLIKLDICKETNTEPLLSLRDLNTRDLISDRAFGLAHILCESKHSNGGEIVHFNLIMYRLLLFTWEGELVHSSQTVPSALVGARDVAITFLKNRIIHSTDEDELEKIALLVPNILARCPEKAEYRNKVAKSVQDLLCLLPIKSARSQLQLVYNFGLNSKAGLRALAVEMAPHILKTMNLDQTEDEEDEREKSRAEKKKGSDEEEEDEDEEGEREKKKKDDEEEEEEDDEMNGTKRKIKKDKKKKKKGDEEDEEEEEMNSTRRKKKKGCEEEEDEDEEGNTTRRKGQKGNKKKNRDKDDEEEEEEEEGNTTKRRGRAAKDQSMIRMKKQKKQNEEESEEEEEESEGEKEKAMKKRKAEKAKLKKAQARAPVQLRPSLLMLVVRACLDKTCNLRARSLQLLATMIRDDGMGEELKEAADKLIHDHPRLIVQVMTGIDNEKEEAEEDDDEDEEAKTRAAKLAELAAAELEIKNGLLYIVKSRMEDDIAGVRKAAINALQSIFFIWEMNDDEAEDIVKALKLRCLDNAQTVRKQAMETLSFLLEESLDKGHRDLMERTWLSAVLPLINDREEGVQTIASKLVEENLINPIMRASTPAANWHMMERVEEEVSNRRLLVRTLAFLSAKEIKTMKETIVTTLYKKLVSDPDHSNVIWMLIADLSTVFGDKIDPRTAVQTWYDLPENETANMMSYVAKVVGEGAKKLQHDEREKVSLDIQHKLFAYRVHGPHIATVYLTLARLMDAVGELAEGTKDLENFGRSLLEEASRIIYSELDMFTEMEEDKQEVAKEEEIRVIRIVITIGEVIQLSPNLIDYAQKLFDGLKLIMSSELYLSDAVQQQKRLNSAAQSRVASAMGNVDGIGSQGSKGVGQETMQHMESGVVGSQPTVIPSQVQQEMKTLSLRKALFTATVRRCALTTIGKFCLMDENIAKQCVYTFVRQLKLNPDHIIRNNIVIVLCDLCIRYTLLVDRYTPIIASCLKDRAILVRQQTLECLTILIKEAFIRWEGQLMYRFVATILDENRNIREYAMFCLKDILLPQNPCMFFNHFIECLLYFNDVPRKYKIADPMDQLLDRTARFSLSGKDNEGSRIKLYEFMLDTFDDKQKFITMAKMCEEIFSSVYSGEMSIEDERVVALLTDAFKVISCEQMKLKLDVGRKGDEEDDEPPEVVKEAAKSMITEVFRTAIITSIMPHVLELRRFLMEKRHPIMRYMMGILRALTHSHTAQLKDFFAGDRIALREIEYDIKRLDNLEAKMKLKAAHAAQIEAARALLPPSRRQSMHKEKSEKEKMKEERGEAEKEAPIHPNQIEIRDEMDDDGEVFLPEEQPEKSTMNENGDNGESVDVEMEMEEPATLPVEKKSEEIEEEKEMEKKGGEAHEKDEEGEEMEVEERGGDNENGEGERGDDEREKENEEVEEVEEVEDNEGGSEEKENNGDNEANKKTQAELGEAEVKEEPLEEEEEEGDKEKKREERRKRRKEENEKKKEIEIAEVEIKEEPLDEGEEIENVFVAPTMIGRRKMIGSSRSIRAPSEMSCMNESVMVGGYGQSTPRKGTPNQDEDGDENMEPPRLDLDISAIAPPPSRITKPRASRKPITDPIEE